MKKGVITIYLTLSLSIICGLLFAVIESIREGIIRMQVEGAADMAINGVFGEYNRELLKKYDLFFVDTSYGSEMGSIQNTGEHLRKYMDANFTNKSSYILKEADWLKLQTEYVTVLFHSLATDENGLVFKRQAVNYIEDKYGLHILKKLIPQTEILKDSTIWGRDVDAERGGVEKQIQSTELPKRQVSEDKWEEIEISNPADGVNAVRGEGILTHVAHKEKGISGKSADMRTFPSNRSLKQGDGMVNKELYSEDAAGEALFGEYIVDKYSNYVDNLENRILEYEVEYILAGKDSDVENLKWVVSRLLNWREISNIIYLFGDTGKQAEAGAMAAVAAGITGMPYFVELIKLSILYAWAYAESVVDAKILLAGGKVPLFKSAGDWNLSISQFPNFLSHLDAVNTEGRGLDYKTYLRLLLFLQNKEEKLFHGMDLIELNLQNYKGNQYFRLDNCLEYIEADFKVISGYGYQYNIRRFFGYFH